MDGLIKLILTFSVMIFIASCTRNTNSPVATHYSIAADTAISAIPASLEVEENPTTKTSATAIDSSVYVGTINAFDSTCGTSLNQNEKRINRMRRDSYRPWLDAECLDVFTHYSAMEWLKTRKPRVLYIAYGETDEWAHSGMYRSYLDAARQTDQWIGELWNWLQSQPQYRNETTLFITTDHGRGDAIKKEWTSHNRQISGAGEIWFAAMGPRTIARIHTNAAEALERALAYGAATL